MPGSGPTGSPNPVTAGTQEDESPSKEGQRCRPLRAGQGGPLRSKRARVPKTRPLPRKLTAAHGEQKKKKQFLTRGSTYTTNSLP